MSTAPKEFTHPSKLSKGQKRRMRKQQKKQQLLLEQELDELEEIECHEQEQRLREMGIYPAEGDAAADSPAEQARLTENEEQPNAVVSTSNTNAEPSTHVLPSGLLAFIDLASHSFLCMPRVLFY